MKERILAILARSMSRLHAEMTLRRAMAKVGMDDRFEDLDVYPRLAVALETSLHLFVPEGQVADAVNQLREVLTPDRPQGVTLELRSEADMSVARQAARNLAQKMGARSFAANHFTTAVSELARNIIQYAKRGVLELEPLFDGRRGLRVRAIDRGPGIANLEEILAGTYKSRSGLGKGILGVQRLMSRFEIRSDDHGTLVEAELYL